MAKPKKGPAFTIQPKRIAAFDALLGDDVAVADDQMDFLSENSVGSLAFLEKGELNIVDLVEKALEDRSLVPRDLKFDDSAMSVPPNFLEWTTSPTYLKADPYLEQALIGIRLFAEWCPRCSNNEWLHIENHEPQEGIAGIRKNLVLLEHNKCPKCGARRSELLKNGELDFYNELAVNAGQRCVTGATPVVTSGGIKPIHHMFIGHTTPGFHKARLGCAAHNGTRIAQVKQIFISSEEAVKCVVLENGMFIEATDDHPLRCVQGFKHVKNIQAGESVQIVLGTNSWGKVTSPTNIFDAGISTRTAALDYLTRNSLGHDTEGTRVYVCDSEQAQMAWSILLNAGFMPDVHRHQHEFYVTFDLTQECRPRSVYLEVLEVHETEPQITYDLLMDGMPQFVAGGFLNHNSGKSVVTAMISTYLTQKILMSQSPTGILGIDPTTMLHGTFVALTQKQASDTLWTPYFQYISQSPWFQQYHEIIRRHERRYGVEVMKIRDTFVMYGHRNLVVYPAGPDGRILRGRTRIFCLSGNSRVNTNAGLVKIENNLTGLSTRLGSSSRNIKHWVKTKLATNMRRVRLANGQYIDLTADHKMLAMLPEKRVWRRADLMQGEYAAVTLGGDFPKQLLLTGPETSVPLREQYIRRMYELGTFTTDELCEGMPKFKGLNSTRAALVRADLLSKSRNGSFGPSVFVVHGELSQALAVSADKTSGIVRDKRDAFVCPERMTPELAHVLAYLVTDGNYGKGKEFVYNSQSLDKAQHYQSCLNTVFGVAFPITSYLSKTKQVVYRVSIGIKEVKNFLRHIGLDAASSRTKRVPECIFRSDRASVVAYINTSILSDGGVRYKGLYYYSESSELVHDVQQLLLRLGYYSVQNKTRNAVTMTAECTALFLEQDYDGRDKRQNKDFLESLSDRQDNLGSQRWFKLPYSDSYIDRSEGVVWTRVVEVTERPNEWVYDVQVDHKDHAFTANGIVVHNCAIDEVAYFDNDADSKKVKASASMVYGALDRSLATVRSAERKQLASGYDNAFTGYFFNISSPVHARDKINELLRLSFGSKKILGIHAPTWKMNPTMPRDSEFLVEAFRRDPVGAARDYGAEAPMSANPFITQPVFIEKSIREKGRNMVVYQHHYIKFPNGKKQRYGSIVKAATTTRPSIMAIDAGYTNNSFALVVGSRNDNSVISVDCLVEIVPKPGIPLSYNKIFEEIIVPLCRARNVRVLLADQWQSLKLLQDALAACSLDASDQYSLKYRDMWGVKTLLESDPPRISLPRLQHADDIYETLKYDGDEYPWCFEGKPTEHLMMQLQTVQDTGHSVLKNTGATDDLWRAMALMTYGFECTEYDEYLVVKETKAINRDPNRLGTMAGRRNVAQSLSKTVGSMALGSVRTRRIGRN